MSFYPSETNTSAQQQWKEAKVPPLWTLGLIKSRTWQDPAENGEILPGYRETEITAGGIKWKGMQKNPGNIWIMGLQRKETMGAEAFRSLWISTSFLVYFALSHLQFEIYWKAIPSSEKELFCFVFHITLQESKDGARAVTTTASTGSVPDWGKQEFRSTASKTSD